MTLPAAPVLPSSAGGPPVLGVVGSAADGLDQLRTALVLPALERGWRVAVTLTPAAAHWLAGTDEVVLLEAATGLPVRSQPRLPTQPRPHPDGHCFVVVPATANTVAKLALGVADNQALTVLCEALGGGVPVVLCPKVNTAHAGHPAWAGHVEVLRRAGVRMVSGGPGEDPPWAAVLEEVGKVLEVEVPVERVPVEKVPVEEAPGGERHGGERHGQAG